MKMDETYFKNYQFEHDFKVLVISPNRAFIKTIQKYILKYRPAKLLDVGCGPAHISGPYSTSGFVVGADINKQDLKNTNRFKNFNPVLSNACSLCFKKDFFDFVLCTEVLEHIPQTDILLKEIAGVAEKNAVILFTLPNGSNLITYLYDHIRIIPIVRKVLRLKKKQTKRFKEHYHEFNIFSVKKKLSEYFDIIEIKNGGFGFKPFNRILKHMYPSLFEIAFLNKFLYYMVIFDMWLSKLDLFHLFAEEWIILCKNRGREPVNKYAIPKNILEILVCPKCKGRVKKECMFVTCCNCKISYPIFNGIVPDMLISDAWPAEKSKKQKFRHAMKL